MRGEKLQDELFEKTFRFVDQMMEDGIPFDGNDNSKMRAVFAQIIKISQARERGVNEELSGGVLL